MNKKTGIKIFRAGLFILSLCVSVMAMVFILLNSKPVQNLVVDRMTDFLSKELQTHVTIGKFEYEWLSFKFSQFRVNDQQQDSLLRIRKLTFNITGFDLWERKLVIGKVYLHTARLNVKKHAGIKGLNIDFIRKYLSGNKKKKSNKSPFIFNISELELSHCGFSYSDERKRRNSTELDPSYIHFFDMSGFLKKVQIIGDSVHAQIKSAKLKEASGIEAVSLNTGLSIGKNIIDLPNLELHTPQSQIKGDLAFLFHDWEDFEDFEDSVQLKAMVRPSLLSMVDLGYLENSLKGNFQTMSMEGKVNGTVRNLKIEQARLGYGSETKIIGKARFKGLPDWDETYMDFDIQEAKTTTEELIEFFRTSDLPPEFYRLGEMRFQGRVNGFIQDIVTSGTWSSELGGGETNLRLHWPDSLTQPQYEGILALNDFNLGKFYQIEKHLGLATFSAKISGESFRFRDMKLNMEVDVKKIEAFRYAYSGIHILGDLNNRLFKGDILLQDPNAWAHFDGQVNFNRNQPLVQADLEVKKAQLHKLHLDSVESELSTHAVLSYSGFQEKNQDGKIYIDHILWNRKGENWLSKSILAEWNTSSDHSNLQIGSSLLDLKMTGSPRFENWIPSLQHLLALYIPQKITSKPNYFPGIFDFRIDLKNTAPFFHQFYPDIKLGLFVIKGHINTLTGAVDGFVKGESLHWKWLDVKGWEGEFEGKNPLEGISFQNKMAYFSIADSFRFSKVNASIRILEDSLHLHWQSEDKKSVIGGDVAGSVQLKSGFTRIRLDESKITVQNKTMTIEEDSRLDIYPSHIYIPDFNIYHKKEYVSVFGMLGKRGTDQLTIRYHRVDLSFLNYFVETVKGGIQGQSQGRIDILGGYESPVFVGDILVDGFVAGKDSIGNLTLAGTFDADKNILNLNGQAFQGMYKGMQLKGNVYIKQQNRMDLMLKIPSTSIHQFEHYAAGVFTDLTGKASADIYIKGTAKNPEITGLVNLEEGHFTIDYLKTRYRFFNTQIKLLNGEIIIPTTPVYEEAGNTYTLLSGSIKHKLYDQFVFDLYVKNAKNILVLNTNEKNNDLFYGVAYASGNAHIHGPMDDIEFDIQARSEKGTRIFIPITETSSSASSEFIRFVQHDTSIEKNIKKEKKVDFSGIRMNLNFTMTPDAEFQLIFDQALGDIIKGNGNGDIRMEVDTRGTFKMFGLYTIEKGNYLFTALNVFSKQFVIKPGGTITWDGDPYQARLNMIAYNQVKASPDPLLTSTGTSTGSAQTQPAITVNCNLFLKGVMLQPDIHFGLEFPDIAMQNSDNNTVLTTVLRQIENDPEELNRQIFSLIMMKRFLPRQGTNAGNPFGGNAAGTSLGASASDLVSSQLSNWLSQFAPGWEVTFNYQTANSTQNRELIVGLLKRFYNDRLLVEASYSIENQLLNNFYSQYILSKDGRFRVTAFRRTTNNPVLNQNVNTNGVGLFYRKEFEHILPSKNKMKIK